MKDGITRSNYTILQIEILSKLNDFIFISKSVATWIIIVLKLLKCARTGQCFNLHMSFLDSLLYIDKRICRHLLCRYRCFYREKTHRDLKNESYLAASSLMSNSIRQIIHSSLMAGLYLYFCNLCHLCKPMIHDYMCLNEKDMAQILYILHYFELTYSTKDISYFTRLGKKFINKHKLCILPK